MTSVCAGGSAVLPGGCIWVWAAAHWLAEAAVSFVGIPRSSLGRLLAGAMAVLPATACALWCWWFDSMSRSVHWMPPRSIPTQRAGRAHVNRASKGK